MDEKRNRKRTLLGALLTAVLCFAVTASQLLYPLDRLITDPLCQTPSVPDNRIRILAIDEKTISAYGEYTDWSRDIPARLVELLDADPDTAPAVIAFDIMYVSDRSAEEDERFARACESGGNVVTAINLVFHTEVSRAGDSILVDRDHIEMVEFPYEALRGTVRYGFANTYLDRDQFVRFSRLKVDYQGQTIWSFPAEVYRRYAETQGFEPVMPKTDSRQLYSFAFTARSGEYETLSLCDVLEGRIDPAAFDDCIVFVGAYAPGMQDNYNAAVQHGSQMYGVEIHANVLEALMEGRTGLSVNPWIYAAAVTLLAVAFYLAISRMKIVPAAILGAGLIAAGLLTCRLLFRAGLVTRVVELIAAVILIYAAHLVLGYILETIKKRRILNAFKKYVAPQVVDEVASKGDFKITLGGEKRHIAVLFVDIRGFTPMSEGLQPEQVVEILNEYLQLTTNSIFKNNGTLDKFIGDATMAVFNAPFDLDDYIYRAVCTARDIAAGSEELERRLMERFGKSVSFGIGVNCGDAVVGNIGCDFRMDYTAIGDTVNTAARLESNAKRGQILISQAVYDALKDRIRVTDVGVIPLKGKSNEIFVYQLDEVLETEAQTSPAEEK